ncbi:MAG: LysE family transporter [Nitrososphaerota archaeon]|jgi:threonine/homoserine/homoserine lactone efflux protein|nr:LysE family transporter [Nitrososphaerota archaeon]
MNLFASAAFGAGLAFSLAVPPGPVNAMIASASVSSSGMFKGTAIGLGAMTADATYLALILLVHQIIPTALERPLALVGGSFLIFLGYSILRKEGSGFASMTGRGYVSGVLVGLSNPYQLGWWLTAGLSMVDALGVASAAGFFGALLVWVILFPFSLNRITRRYGSYFPRAIRLVSGIAVIAFGLYFIGLALV